MPSARLRDIDLPDFGAPETMPSLPAALYAGRLNRLKERMASSGYDRLAVYADREHSANLSYLTGFDPRFEEALLVVGMDESPAVLVGNECWGMAGSAPLPMRRHLYQDFSLPSQPRDQSLPLAEILASEGVDWGDRVGVAGWKMFDDRTRMEVPAFIVDELRTLVGSEGLVENAGFLFQGAADGLRVINETEQLVAFEYAACHTSNAVRRLIQGLEPGMTEQEAVRLLEWNGMPLSCHLMLTAGPRASMGLLGPGDRPIAEGDPLTVAYGVWGALNCRAGFVVEDSSDLAEGIGDYVDRLVAPYFEAIAEWYEALHVGQSGAVLYEIIERRLGDPFFGIFLNPGHQLHLDEWVNSPIAKGSTTELRSGMTLQVDVIPATGTGYFTTNIEDGIALGDESLRSDLERSYPRVWKRILARRDFMAEELGIDLHDDVLPLSNIPGWLPPFLLGPERAMSLV